MTLRRTLPPYSVAVMTGIYVLNSPLLSPSLAPLLLSSCLLTSSHFSYDMIYIGLFSVWVGLPIQKEANIFVLYCVLCIYDYQSIAWTFIYSMLTASVGDWSTNMSPSSYPQSFSEAIGKEIRLGVWMKIGKCCGIYDFLTQQPKHSPS